MIIKFLLYHMAIRRNQIFRRKPQNTQNTQIFHRKPRRRAGNLLKSFYIVIMKSEC